MLLKKDLEYIAGASNVQVNQAQSVVEMLVEGMTVPFISRYRKEKTGSLDEVKVLSIQEHFDYLKELNDRKATILKTIKEQEKLSDELKQKIENTYSKTDLEDIYLPYKPKRRTKATIAKEKGLESLALKIIKGEREGKTLEESAISFINPEKGVDTVEQALEGAGHIIAELFSENAEVRKDVREFVASKGILEVNVTDEFKDQRTKFEQYYDYQEQIKGMPSHRILAVRRGEKEKILKTHVAFDKENIVNISRQKLFEKGHVHSEFLEVVMIDALSRLILPSVELDIRMEMKKIADEDAIGVFAENLKNLLLASPAGNVSTLGVDPGFRTGCKLVALSETGKLLDTATIFPTKPFEKIDESEKIVLSMLHKHRLNAVVIGNGTASRETRDFMKSVVPEGVIVTVVNEAGASVYSASEAGRDEFPDYDLTVRGSVSIGRRFQDPLSELVKIDPKSIGVGQYQHDVSQSLLKKKLDNVVVSVVNNVGVDINTASYHLLKYVSGIGETLAKNIVSFRDENGMFMERNELKNVRMFGDKAFQQSAGFMRIREGENPLDKTGIHPESYKVVKAMAASLKTDVEALIGNKDNLNALNPHDFVTDEFGIPTIQDILKELETPGRDPREEFELFEFEEGINEITDLTEGMVLKGVVTNVTKFGAFVDIGVHQDGLVHISQLANRFISSPEEVVSVGDKVDVKVVSVDVEMKRIGLSIKALMEDEKPQTKRRDKRQQKQQGVKKPEKTYQSSLEQLQNKWGS